MDGSNQYEFVITTDGSNQAYGAARGHAIRSAFRSAVAASSDLVTLASSSQKTALNKKGLTGRFRLAKKDVPERERRASKTVRRLITPCILTNFGSATGLQLKRPYAASHSGGVPRLGSTTADPFCSLPVTTTQAMDGILKYCMLYRLAG